MTTALFEKIIKIDEKSVPIFEGLIERNMHEKLFDHMKLDGIFRYKFAKLLLAFENNGKVLNYNCSKDCKNDPEVIDKLGKDQLFFPDKLRLYFEMAEKNNNEGKLI